MKNEVPTAQESRVAASGYRRRSKKLVKPWIQLRMMLMFLLATSTVVVGQAILIMFMLTRIATQLPNDGELLIARLQTDMWLYLGITVLFFGPFMMLVGMLGTFRILGPIYRFELYLREIADGGKPADCRIRKGDLLHDLCDLINETTAPLRQTSEDGSEEAEGERTEAA